MGYRVSDCVVACAVVVLATGSLQGSDWPTYRADTERTGYTFDSLPNTLELKWVYRNRAAPTPAWPRSSRITFDFAYHPIIVGNVVVIGSSAENKIVAIDAASGRLMWTFIMGSPVRFAPVAWRDRVLVAGDDGCLYAITLKDGMLLWKHRGGPNERMCLGNERMVSRWPVSGGPVVTDDTVSTRKTPSSLLLQDLRELASCG